MRPIAWTQSFGDSTFIPAGCLHWPIGEKDLLRKWVRTVAETPNAFTMLMGDSLDSARTHYRDHVRAYRSDQNSQIQLDEWNKRDVAELAKELRPIKDKIIGVIRGNHYWEYADGTNSEQELCRQLGLTYLGPVGIVRVDFRDKSGKCRHTLVIYGHHHGGSMGGRTTGGDVAGLERSELSFDADIYVLSHTHRRHGFKVPKLGITSKGPARITEYTRVFIRSGAFLKGFGEDHPSKERPHFPTYAEEKALRPTDLGFVALEIKLSQIHNRSNKANEVRREFTLRY